MAGIKCPTPSCNFRTSDQIDLPLTEITVHMELLKMHMQTSHSVSSPKANEPQVQKNIEDVGGFENSKTKLKCSVKQTDDIIGNGSRKLLIIGKTGTGKSTLCNVLTGNPFDADIFPVSAGADSCTQKTKFCDAFLAGNREVPVSIIDTIGFDDPSTDNDAETVAELVEKLKNACDHVNCFVLAVNGASPRLDGSLVGMIRLFEGIFGEQFWQQMVVVFTRMPMDNATKKRRLRSTNNQTDDDLARQYMHTVNQKFGEKAKKLGYLFIDSTYNAENDEENEAFKAATDKLEKLLLNSDGLLTTKIEVVATEHQKLRNKISQAEEERKDYEEKAEMARKEKEEQEVRFNLELQKIENEQLKKEKEKEKDIEKLKQEKLEAEKTMTEMEKKNNDENVKRKLDEIERQRKEDVRISNEKIKESEKRHKKELEMQKQKYEELDQKAKTKGFSAWDFVPIASAIRRIVMKDDE